MKGTGEKCQKTDKAASCQAKAPAASGELEAGGERLVLEGDTSVGNGARRETTG